MSQDADVIVIGAGAAGLAAAAELAHSGLSVVILEARDRIGGRIFTQRDFVLRTPIENGAEFIHGRPAEIWDLLGRHNITPRELTGQPWCFREGRLSQCDWSSQVDDIFEKMDSDRPDESFLSFLNRCCPDQNNNPQLREARERALEYVVGFNAADPSKVGVHWLVKGMLAEQKIHGDRAFRAPNGYEDLIEIFTRELSGSSVDVRFDTTVSRISWRKEHADIEFHQFSEPSTSTAARVLVTLPVSILQASVRNAGGVRFTPSLPPAKLEALRRLEMGSVMRVTLRFRNRFWDTISPDGYRETLSEMSFLFSDDDWFPTWWTSLPEKLPIITAWAPDRRAVRLSGQSRDFVIEQSLQTLSRLLRIGVREIEPLFEVARFHDWQEDPFSRGAYSYGSVGSDGAQEMLASAVENTLFFAGEATDVTGNNGTVHGAIASGLRAAKEIVASFR